MNEQTHALLMSVDEKGSWEYPRKFDRQAYWQELEALKPMVEHLFLDTLTFDRHVEDASYFTDLYTEPVLKSGGYHQSYLCIRFSNFGRLFSLLGEAVHNPDEQEKIRAIISLLESRGFHYIPQEAVDGVPYDGVNPPYEPDLTWWTRYFDYL